jgi:hypothetical protein
VLEAFQRGGEAQSLSSASPDGVDLLGNPTLEALEARKPKRAELYSPSQRAAENLKQKKGPYEQMRAMLVKGGAKEDELEWTGADRFFKGKKVTQQELIDYFRDNSDAISVDTNMAGKGRIGGSVLDNDPAGAFDQWFQGYVVDDTPFVSEETDIFTQDLVDDLWYRDDVTPVQNLTEEEIADLAEETGLTEDDILRAEFVYDGSGKPQLFLDGWELVEATEGGREELERQALENLRIRYVDEFDSDPEGFAEQYDMASYVDESFDAGNTKYSDYFPEGAENYQENLLRYADPQGNIKSRDIASSSHWGRDDDSTIYHWRQGDYDLADAGQFGGLARYIGEIQSDPQQNLDGDVPAPYGFLADRADFRRKQSMINDSVLAANTEADKSRIELADALLEWAAENPEASSELIAASRIKEINDMRELDNMMAELDGRDVPPLEPFPLDMNEMTEAQKAEYIDYFNSHPRREPLIITNPSVTTLVSQNPNALARYTGGSLDPEIASRIARYNSAVSGAEQAKRNFQDFLDQNTLPQGDYVEGGPFMSSQNKWLDNALRRSIVDAVNDPDVNYLTFPFSEEAIGKVGGNAFSPKQGTIDYYQRDTQNRLKKILRGIDPSVEMENVELRGTDSGEIGDFMSRGFRLTPQFRDKVRESGLPAWMIAGGVGLSGLMEYLQQKREEQKYGPRRSLLEL